MSTFITLANILKRSDVNNLPQVGASSDNISNSLKILYEVVGALAFLMVLIAALRYVLNSDDPTKISEAKRMIVYTIVGLIVIVLAATIVGYVLNA